VHAHPDHTLDRIIHRLGREGISQLPVVSRRDTSKLLGIINMDDVTRALSLTEDDKEEEEIAGDSVQT
jgi:CBS domain-containing protein